MAAEQEITLVRELVGAGIISVSILALFVVAELIHRLADVPTERTRKLTHVGAGAVVASLPWLLQSHWTVLILSFSFFGLLALGKVTGLLGSIHRIRRRSGGAYYYPFAVYLLYLLADGDKLLYLLPILIMALSDTAAALVGQRFGQRSYRVLDGSRTLEGSSTFLGLTFLLCLVGFALDGRAGWPSVLLLTLVVALVATAVEAVSVRGSDNLLIPVAVWFVLDRTLGLPLEALGAWMLGMALVLSMCLVAARVGRLSTSGLILCFLVGSLAWGLGGPAWFWPVAGWLAITSLARFAWPGHPDRLDLEVLFPVLVTGLAMLLIHASTGIEALYMPYVASMLGAAATAAVAHAAGRGRDATLPAGVASAALVWSIV